MSTPTRAGDTVAPQGGSGRLVPGARRPLSGVERVSAAVGYHHRVYLRTWRGTLIGRFASPLFFLASMGLGLGGLVDDRTGGIDGVPYLQYVAGGILAMQAMWLAFGESTYPVMTYIRWNQMYAGMLATPLSVVEVLLGHLLYVAFQLGLTTAIFIVVAAVFGAFTSPWVVLALPVCVLVGLAFAVPLFAFSAHIENDNAFALLFRFLATPVMLFSGVFFPIEQLPALLQAVAWVLPLGHGVELVRAVSGGMDLTVGDLGHLAVLLAYIGVGWLLARRSFTRRLAS